MKNNKNAYEDDDDNDTVNGNDAVMILMLKKIRRKINLNGLLLKLQISILNSTN